MTFASSAFANSAFQTDAAPGGGAHHTGGHGGGHGHGRSLEWTEVAADLRRKWLDEHEDKPAAAVVELEGEEFPVASRADVRSLLAQVRQAAQEIARDEARSALPSPVVPQAPALRVVSPAPDLERLQAQVNAANAELRAIYARAWQQRMEQEDEDEAVGVLLLH